jgi:hypothetical protein
MAIRLIAIAHMALLWLGQVECLGSRAVPTGDHPVAWLRLRGGGSSPAGRAEVA